MLRRIITLLNSIRFNIVFIRINIWNVYFLHKWILLKFLEIFLWFWDFLHIAFCCLWNCFWMLTKWWSKLIRFIAWNTCCNIELLLHQDWWIWKLVLHMIHIFLIWSLHLKSNDMFIIVRLIMMDHMRLLNEDLSSALDSFMAWNYFIWRDNFRSFWKLNDVVCLWDYSFWIIVSWLLNDFNLFTFLSWLIRSLFTR